MQSIFFLYECNRSPIRQEIIALLRSKGGIANTYTFGENGNAIVSIYTFGENDNATVSI